MATETVPAADTTKELAELARNLVFTAPDTADRTAAERRILDLVEQEHQATGDWPQRRSDEREKAIGAVLSDIAGACFSIKTLACAAIQHGDSNEGGAMLEGLEALAGRVGALADRVSYMLTREPGTLEDDTWLHAPRTCEALKVLEAGRREADSQLQP